MSGLSPARRLRTKTSDFSEFFRGNSSHVSSSQPTNASVPNDVHISHQQQSLEVPNIAEASTSSHTSSAAKKFSSKLPFLGRSRKKSNVEESSASAARERDRNSPYNAGRHETAHSAAHQTQSDSVLRPTKSRDGPQQSLGSKFAAHFTPSRPRKSDAVSSRKVSLSPSKSRQSPSESAQPDNHTLHPPPKVSPRGRSFESTSSGASRDGQRSTTPRPSQSQQDQQPTFTVSISPPDDFSLYADLFTRPRKKTDSSSQVRVSSSTGSTPSNRDSDERTTGDLGSRSSSQSTSPGIRFPTPPNGGYGVGEDGDQIGVSEDTPVRPGSRSSVRSAGKQHQKTESVDGKTQAQITELRLSEDSVIDKERPFPVPPLLPPQSTAAMDRRPTISRISTQVAERATVTPRTGRARSASGSRPNGAPPTIPLPSPPPSASPNTPLPSPPPSAAPTPPPISALPIIPTPSAANSRKSVSSISSISSTQSTGFLSRRTRANTIPSVPPHIASSIPSTPSLPSSPVPTAAKPPPSSYTPSPASSPYLKSLKHDYLATDSERSDWDRSDWDRSDIESMDRATPDQLKQALVAQNLRLDELMGYLQRLTEKHEAEKNEMREKIETLERDAARKDQEIKGLTYLVHRGGGAPWGAASPSHRSTPRSGSASPRPSPLSTSTSLSDTEKTNTKRRMAIVSGTQSDGGRGAMTSDSEAEAPSSVPMLPPSLRRNKTAVGSSSSSPKLGGVAVRSTSTRCVPKPLGTEFSTSSLIPFASSAVNKRASTSSSFSLSSTTSSTSSLLPPSSVAPSTISSSLSSIPETPPPLPPPKAALPAILQSHHQQVLSTPKPATKRAPSLTPAAAYAANLRKNRPPSIAQVLEQEENKGKPSSA